MSTKTSDVEIARGEAPSTALVPSNGDGDTLAQVDQARAALPSLIEAGDVETLKRWRREGDAASLAAKKLGCTREAMVLARQSVRCAAALGVLDAEGRDGGYAAENAHNEVRKRWRTLGAALVRNHLEAVLDECGQEVSESRGALVAGARGEGGVPRGRLVALLRKTAAERGTTLTGLERETGAALRHYVKLGRGREPDRCEWWPAMRVAATLGIDIRHLPPVPAKRAGRPPAKWVTHRFRPGDGSWEEAATRWRAFRDEVRRATGDVRGKPQLYEAMHTVSDILQREVAAEDESA
jgi:hypothetical protein